MRQKKATKPTPVKRGKSSKGSSQSLRGRHRRPETIYSFEEADARLRDVFINHEFGHISREHRQQLVKFYQLLMNHQLTDNVTRLLKFRDIAIKHFIDSLIVADLTELDFPLLDMGTGPGFPGIPLKILYPDSKIILAEGVRRRVDFLKAVRDEMKLKELDVIGRNIDETFLYPVQGVITRAVEDTGATLRHVSQCLNVGGRLFLMKGPNVDAELKSALKEWGEYFRLEQDHSYNLPRTPHERRLLVFRKIQTPDLPEWDEEDA